MSVKKFIYVKKIMFGILLTCSCKNRIAGKQLPSITDNSTIMCDEVIESYDEENKTISKNFMKNVKFLYFTCILINFYSIIDSCQYLLLFDKISSKTKTLITILHHK